MRILSVLLAFCCLGLADFSGTYKGTSDGAEFELKLTQSDKTLAGKATTTIAGKEIGLNVKGTVDGDTASGTVIPDGAGDDDKLLFKATLSGGDIEMKLADPGDDGKGDWAKADKIEFKRVGDAPAKTEEGSKLSKFINKPQGVLADGKEYTHPSGGKFRYPSSWTLKEVEDALILTPPDMAEGKEFYFISGEKAQGATDPASKQVGDYLKSVIEQSVGPIKQVGNVDSAPAGNAKGAVYTWDGNVQGSPARIRAYVTILKGYGISLVAIASKEKIEERDKVLRGIFYTFGWGQGKIDQRLVGSWQYYSYKSGRETKAAVTLGADGTFSLKSDSEFSANLKGTDSLGNDLWTGGVNSRSGGGWKGTWFSDGSEITLNFEDGSQEKWDYTLEMQGSLPVIKLTGNDPKKPMEWSKIG